MLHWHEWMDQFHFGSTGWKDLDCGTISAGERNCEIWTCAPERRRHPGPELRLKTNAFATGPIAMQADGKIIFKATFAPENSDVMWASVLRSAPDGSIDSSFSSELHGILRSIAIQSNGRILAAGELFTQDGRRYALDRLLSDGSPDPEFHQTRFVTNGDAWTMTTQPDDKILVAGLFEDVNGNPRRNLARLNSDGSLDTFFDAGVALPGFATSIALQADSNVLVSGGVFANPDSIQ